MGFKSMFKKMLKEGEELLNKDDSVAPPATDPSNPPTRWEKSVVALNGIVKTVSKIDPDGIDVYCFPGSGTDVDVYRNVKDIKSLESMVTSKQPGGPCHMGDAMDMVFRDAFTRGFAKPCSILVFTAGRPDDHEGLQEKISNAAKSVQQESDLSVTFVQVGDDAVATSYLKQLDENHTYTSASGETIDIVDTVKDEDIQAALGEFKEQGFMGKGGTGALFGAFAGAAMGVGGMYLYNKQSAKKRTKGWNGQWKAIDNEEGEEIAVLTIIDDGAGTLQIEGWPDFLVSTGEYAENEYGYNIQYTRPGGDEPIDGTVEDEHNISWSDGTRWEEVDPEGADWKEYAGAATAGAAATGAAGYLIQKKFFKKASDHVESDYVIVMDRSYMMTVKDAGK